MVGRDSFKAVRRELPPHPTTSSFYTGKQLLQHTSNKPCGIPEVKLWGSDGAPFSLITLN